MNLKIRLPLYHFQVDSRCWWRILVGQFTSWAMKNLRLFLMCFSVVVITGIVSGCATTSHDSPLTSSTDASFEKKTPSPTEDMTAVEKIGYYLSWFCLNAAYGWAGGDQSYWPQ